ncbi:MAG: acyl carrier protein [Pseudomonadota bacterium]
MAASEMDQEGGIQEDDDLVFRKICSLLEPLNDKGVKFSRDTDIISDLEIDSVSVLDVVMEVEDTYDISIPVNVISETKTIGDLVDAIHQTKKEQA